MKKFNCMKDVEEYAKENQRMLVVYDTKVLDVSQFVQSHPGGSHLITCYKSQDITDKMQGHFPLSLQLATTMSIGTLDKEIKFYLDREEPLLQQIWNIDHETYIKIVHMPHWVFQQSPRMFRNPVLQSLSYCSWYNIYYFPFSLILFNYLTYVRYNWQPTTILSALSYCFLGILFFTLIEYSIHRFLFHSEKKLYDHKLMRYLHFMLHGIHHMFPFDPYRLVLPPSFVALLIGIGYLTIYKILNFAHAVHDMIFWAGFLIGYLSYDTIHYWLHHLKKQKNPDQNILKKIFLTKIFIPIQDYHNKHHYSGEDAGYGVSSPLWDIILGTLFKRNKSH